MAAIDDVIFPLPDRDSELPLQAPKIDIDSALAALALATRGSAKQQIVFRCLENALAAAKAADYITTLQLKALDVGITLAERAHVALPHN